MPPRVPVHPRVCGEQHRATAIVTASTGSSPRVRGTEFALIVVASSRRFIPACAGNSQSFRDFCFSQAVHPRVCGEQLLHPAPKWVCLGSSPRVRGTGGAAIADQLGQRFIPACAGNRLHGGHKMPQTAVHPRVCGEQLVRGSSARAQPGSSPRVRGTVGRRLNLPARRRFIPACAGNSRPCGPPLRPSPVHPRVCGEQICGSAKARSSMGSSPRVRGTGGKRKAGQHPRRFIPACAGNRAENSGRVVPETVHPRVCGEQLDGRSIQPIYRGSSPRVRGTARTVSAVEFMQRFIRCAARDDDHMARPLPPR